MDLSDVEKLVAQGESETVEFKKSTGQLSRAGETLCAFLNGFGGHVLVGVDPTGRIVGQRVADSTMREIAALRQRFEPAAPVEIERVAVDPELDVLVLRAAVTLERRPFTFAGRAYERVGPTTSQMPQTRYEQLLLDRAHARSRWENEAADARTTIAHLDAEEILRTVRLGVAAGRLPESSGNEVADILERLGVMEDGRIFNAAVVLFGTRFVPAYPQCQLRLARFRGTDKSEFLDQRQLEGNAFQLLEEAMLFLRRHLPVAGRILPGLFERADEPLFPLAALREALVNGICHRDYAVVGGAVSLAVFDDRLEVWSDGTLPAGLTLDDLKREHLSRPRNPLIARVFYRRGLVERWGRGTQKIVELCVKAGHPEPEFIEQAGAVGVRFRPGGYVAPHRVAHDLTDRQREILHALASVPQMPFREIRAGLANPPSERTLRDDLAQLRRLGLITYEGFGRGATWRLLRTPEGTERSGGGE